MKATRRISFVTEMVGQVRPFFGELSVPTVHVWIRPSKDSRERGSRVRRIREGILKNETVVSNRVDGGRLRSFCSPGKADVVGTQRIYSDENYVHTGELILLFIEAFVFVVQYVIVSESLLKWI